jgi:acyl dehydratase
MKYYFKGEFNINQLDIIKFAELSGDNNPIHLDENIARNLGFEKQIVHGVMLAGIFSKHFGTVYPGNGAIYLGQTLNFKKPVYSNNTYIYEIILIEFDEVRYIGYFNTIIYNLNNEICLEGEAKLKWKV